MDCSHIEPANVAHQKIGALLTGLAQCKENGEECKANDECCSNFCCSSCGMCRDP